ncbi:MAG TPA: alpha/beta fold hydrolase [Gemmatimonadales bacterium]|nr:alpha/beta fold hydrolase [Gemmatimonadales bacterium]
MPEPRTARETTVRVRGVELFTRRVGQGPAAIVLHGGPGAHHDYLLPGFDALADGRELLYYDQRGGGRSAVGREVPVGWTEHTADLDALRDHWELERVTLLGYSWGGLLALLYALEHPGRVERLALVSPAPAWRAAREQFEHVFARRNLDPEFQEERRRLRESGLRERDPAAFQQRIFELSVAPYFFDPSMARELTPFRVTGRTQQEVWRSLGDYDLRPRLDELRRLPSLVLHGEDDPIPIAAAMNAAELIGAEFHPLARCGHVPYVEAFEEFKVFLDRFLPLNTGR